jgi:hypothetical protein
MSPKSVQRFWDKDMDREHELKRVVRILFARHA